MLNRKNIPVVVVNREIGEGCDYLCYTGTDTYAGAVVSAKILAEAMGGYLEYEHVTGRTSFVLSLPLAGSDAEDAVADDVLIPTTG